MRVEAAAVAAGDPAARRVGLGLLGVTVVGWGLNWPVIKVLLETWPPLFARGTSGLAAAGLLAALAAATGASLRVAPRDRLALVRAALLNVTAWMGLATLSMAWLSVGEAALAIYTMPIWAALMAWPLLGLRPGARDVAALGLGIAGLLLLFGDAGLSVGADRALGLACALGAALFFAYSTVAVRAPAALPPLASTAWQLGLGSLPMILVGIVWERPDSVALGGSALWAWLYLAVVAMAACYLSWFGALRRLVPTAAGYGTMLIPVIGTLSAAVMLGEPFGLRQTLALALVVAGIALALGRRPAA